MHTVLALLCFVVVIHWLIFPYPSGLLHWHCGNLTIAPVPAKQPWWIWINTSCEFIMNDCITTAKQSTTKPCAHFLGYTVSQVSDIFDLTIYMFCLPWIKFHQFLTTFFQQQSSLVTNLTNSLSGHLTCSANALWELLGVGDTSNVSLLFSMKCNI